MSSSTLQLPTSSMSPASNSSAATPSPEIGVNTGQIAGIAIGSTFLLIIGAALAYLARKIRRKRNNRAPLPIIQNDGDVSNPQRFSTKAHSLRPESPPISYSEGPGTSLENRQLTQSPGIMAPLMGEIQML